MLHFVPDYSPELRPRPYAEAVSRLASIRHALRLVDALGNGPSPDEDDTEVAAKWDDAGAARQRCFDRRTGHLVGATAAGVEALLNEHQQGRNPHAEASQTLVEDIRRELAGVSRLITG
jgi:hypothetical protein